MLVRPRKLLLSLLLVVDAAAASDATSVAPPAAASSAGPTAKLLVLCLPLRPACRTWHATILLQQLNSSVEGVQFLLWQPLAPVWGTLERH